MNWKTEDKLSVLGSCEWLSEQATCTAIVGITHLNLITLIMYLCLLLHIVIYYIIVFVHVKSQDFLFATEAQVYSSG